MPSAVFDVNPNPDKWELYEEDYFEWIDLTEMEDEDFPFVA